MKGSKPEVAAEPSAKAATKWVPLFADPNGTVDLKVAFPSATPAGVYIRTFVYSAKAQTATGSIASDDAFKIWVNEINCIPRLGT